MIYWTTAIAKAVEVQAIGACAHYEFEHHIHVDVSNNYMGSIYKSKLEC